MEYYKILLVDDELEIRDGMIQKLDWHKLGYDVAAAAENGVEALEKAEQVQPDVIMTDIRMPFMDGLEFIGKVIELRPAVKIIVFSGFDDFEYAQKAIKLGVEEYILKPVSARQLEQSLVRLKSKMDEELEQKRNIDLLRRSYEDSFPILKEQFFVSVIEGRMLPRQIEQWLNQYKLSFASRYKVVAVLSAGDNSFPGGRKNDFAGSEELIPIAVRKTAEDIVGKYHELHSFFIPIISCLWLRWSGNRRYHFCARRSTRPAGKAAVLLLQMSLPGSAVSIHGGRSLNIPSKRRKTRWNTARCSGKKDGLQRT